MTSDLFSQDDWKLQRIPAPDAEIYYAKKLDFGHQADVVLRRLLDETPWRSDKVVVWGKSVSQPRLTAWYGDLGRNYSYSGVKMNPLPWTDLLLGIKVSVEKASNFSFNSVLLNYYRSERDSMGLHSDDERELGERPIIASVSLGEERDFVLKHKHDRSLRPLHLKLAHGSLLLMGGDTQRMWRHGIPKENRPLGPRVNLTFRRIFLPGEFEGSAQRIVG